MDPLSSVVSDLTRLLGPGKAMADPATLEAYATDASIYRIVPKVVVLPETTDEVGAVLAYACRTGIPLTARAGGTNLAGNALGEGIIWDCSRMNRILELNSEERWVRVQPGITYAELNRRLEAHGLRFAPDPSSGDTCKLGGMLANNAAGPHTLKYGAVKDNTIDLDVLLPNGQALTVREEPMMAPGFHDLLARYQPIRAVHALVQEQQTLIKARRLRVTKNSSGYNLFALADGLDRGVLDLPRLLIGSEGTLALLQSARLRLIPIPRRTATLLVYLRYLEELGPLVTMLLRLEPSAMEMMDAHTLDLVGRGQYNVPGDTAAMLLVEFDNEDVETTVALATREISRTKLSREVQVATEREAQERLWQARKAIYPALYQCDAKKKPLHFVDDVVVPPDKIHDLVGYLDRRFAGDRITVAIYGHIGNGNIHINPLLDLSDPGDYDQFLALYREIHETVITQFDGSICGEHGDGRVRAPYVKALFGEELYALFVQVKRAFDPEGILNPGVKLSDTSLTAHVKMPPSAKPRRQF